MSFKRRCLAFFSDKGSIDSKNARLHYIITYFKSVCKYISFWNYVAPCSYCIMFASCKALGNHLICHITHIEISHVNGSDTVHTRKNFHLSCSNSLRCKLAHTAHSAGTNLCSFYKCCEALRCYEIGVMVLPRNHSRLHNILCIRLKTWQQSYHKWILNLELKTVSMGFPRRILEWLPFPSPSTEDKSDVICQLPHSLHFTWIYSKIMLLKDRLNSAFTTCMIYIDICIWS